MIIGYKRKNVKMIMPNRKLIAHSVNLGPYSKRIIILAWWLRLNVDPVRFKPEVTLNPLTIHPQVTERFRGLWDKIRWGACPP